jgi:Holliday junction DNA helicase RuvA
MIGFLKGQVVEQSEEGVVLDVNGVGYDLTCSSNTLSDLDTLGASQGTVQVWVQTYVREDAISLFGFSTTLEKRMFLSLVKVNGVGPKMAVKILSGASMNQLSQMIEAGDVKALSSLPKVGKKTAEQMVLALKGKLVLSSDFEAPNSKGKKIAALMAPRFEGPRANVLSALVNLGFRMQDAEGVVHEMPEDIEFQQGVRKALQVLSGI